MKSDTQDQDQAPLAGADGSAVEIELRESFELAENQLEADEAGRRIVVCSEHCRAAADPETLWVRKYGEPPRTFIARPGSGVAVPIKRKRRTISVRLVPDDWKALVHFVTGDLHNMEDSEIKEQLTRILDSIQRSVALSPNTEYPSQTNP